MSVNNTKKNNGFTLVEMLVATAIFVTVMTISVSSLITVINANKNSEELRNVIDNVTFAIESISKEAQASQNFKCGQTDINGSVTFTSINDCVDGGNAVQYVTYDLTRTPSVSTTTEYRYIPGDSANANLQRRKCAGKNNCSNAWENITAPISVVNLTGVKFFVFGANATAYNSLYAKRQPRILISAEGNILSKGKNISFNLQTTANQFVAR